MLLITQSSIYITGWCIFSFKIWSICGFHTMSFLTWSILYGMYQTICIYIIICIIIMYILYLETVKRTEITWGQVVLVLNNDNLDYLHLNARYSADLYSMLTKSRRGTIAPLDIKCHCVSVQNGHHLWKFNIFSVLFKALF